jgi:single-strand DNA-binding protein
MSSVNKAILVGNLGRDPEQKTVGDAKLVTFPLATSESWTDKGSQERRERVTWHQISIWNDALAEVAMKYLKKGSKAYVEGQIETRSWESNGETRYATEIVLRPFKSELVLLDRPDRPAEEQPQGGRARRAASAEPSGRR